MLSIFYTHICPFVKYHGRCIAKVLECLGLPARERSGPSSPQEGAY